MIFEPLDVFYARNREECDYHARSYIANGPKGKVTVYMSPEAPITIGKVANGEYIWVDYVYTDKILKDYEEYGASSIGAALYHHFLPANHPGFNQHPDYFKGYYPYEQQADALETWNLYAEVAAEHVLPAVSYTGDEASRKATIEAAGKANFSAAVSNIILGKASIDTLDAAVKASKKAGYDELLKINQAAYDRYIKAIGK